MLRDLYLNPVHYGIDDVAIPEMQTRARVLFPSEEGAVFGAAILGGTYPLVVFVHGSREGDTSMCPADTTLDYFKWHFVLHQLARCGFVVVTPDVHGGLYDNSTAELIEGVVSWMHHSWQDRAVLWRPGVFIDPDVHRARAAAGGLARYGITHLGQGIGVDPTLPGGITTPVGLAGHSLGAKVCARVAVGRRVRVSAIASIAGSWDDNEAWDAFIDARQPTLMIAGTADQMNASYLQGFWPSLVAPKYQGILQGIGHWDWFGQPGAIRPCDAQAPRPKCSVGYMIGSEMLLTFMTKQLKRQWRLPAHLIGPSGDRPPLDYFFEEGRLCGLSVRWDDPLLSTRGEKTFGAVPDFNGWQ